MESGFVEVLIAVLVEPAICEAVGWGAQGYAGAVGVVEVELESGGSEYGGVREMDGYDGVFFFVSFSLFPRFQSSICARETVVFLLHLLSLAHMRDESCVRIVQEEGG